MIPLKLKDIQQPILTAKSMIIKNLKNQMLAGNNLKMCVGAGFEISLTLDIENLHPKLRYSLNCYHTKIKKNITAALSESTLFKDPLYYKRIARIMTN